MKYVKVIQGRTSKVDGRWHSPKNMNEPGGFEHNLEHGLLTEITEDQLKYAGWGEGTYFKDEEGKWVCFKSNWDSSG